MKLVCLIRDEPPLRSFANRVHREHGLDLVVVEAPIEPASTVSQTLAYARQHGIRAAQDAIREKVRDSRRARLDTATLDREFGESWQRLADDIPSLRVDSVNDGAVTRSVQELGEVALLVHGTSLVRDALVHEAATTLNIHWGLSPYYRGVRCTEWALILWDPANIGVTVHGLSQNIDGGAIAGQERASVAANDSVFSINMQLTRLGTEIVCEILRRLATGNEIQVVEQDLSAGVLTSTRHWSPSLSRLVARMERDGSLERMLRAPNRGPLPIVDLDSVIRPVERR